MARRTVAVERRRFERIPLAIPVFVRGQDQDGKDFLEFATALNISAGGALLATRRVAPKSSVISLEIPSAPLPRMALLPKIVRRLKARLLRSSLVDGYHLWAVRFRLQPLREHGSPRKVHSVR
ncbi:MAG: PilZ domain-containing protein [Acidobacteria bacterium]|nr:PilZ domain-containing protein [Acidobacteriota bacterium]